MKPQYSTDDNVNDYIDRLIEENDELKIQLNELKKKRSLDYEYKELVFDILSASKEIYEKNKLEDENKNITEFSSNIIRYITTFLNDYKIR